MATKFVVFVAILCLTQVLGAPQPIDWRQVGRNALNLGKKAIPAGCNLLGGPQPPQIYYVNPYYQYPQGNLQPLQYPQGNVQPLQYPPQGNRQPFQYRPQNIPNNRINEVA